MTRNERLIIEAELDYLDTAIQMNKITSYYANEEHFNIRYHYLRFMLNNQLGYDVIKEDGRHKIRKR